MANVNTLLGQAIVETRKLNSDESFFVKDLFEAYEWNRIHSKDRLLLGALFVEHTKSQLKSIIAIEKTLSIDKNGESYNILNFIKSI